LPTYASGQPALPRPANRRYAPLRIVSDVDVPIIGRDEDEEIPSGH
jgi:hypothetical protein